MSDPKANLASSIAAGLSLSRAEIAVTARELAAHYYREEREAIYRYLVSLGANPTEAQDLAQETFLRLYIALRKGKEIENIKAWLFTVASNLALNQKRWWKYRPAADETAMARWVQSGAEHIATPEHEMLERETAVRLKTAISLLSPQQKACLYLRAEGFRYREIARMLGVALPTVAEFMRRAVAKLRKAMNE